MDATRRFVGVLLGLTILTGGAFAQRWTRGPARPGPADVSRFSLAMEGGLGTLERGRGMVDLRLEAQVGITGRFRLGLGAGYMNRGRGHRDGMDDNGRNGRTVGEVIQKVRVVPLSLNLYYALPLGRRAAAFMSAGGSCYFGSFDGAWGRQTKNAWGGQAGLGFEYRLAPRFNLVAEGSYRFAEFRGLRAPRNESFINFFPEGIYLQPELNRIYRLAVRALEDVFLPSAPRPVDFDFNGFSLRAGFKFGI